MSDFDTLLDFGETDTTKKNGSTHQPDSADEFDPFGPSPTIEAKGGRGGGDLLVDFSADDQASSQENGLTGVMELSYNSNMADNVTLMYEHEKSSEGEATNPSVEEEDVTKPEASNPLYDFTSHDQSNGQEDHQVDLLGTMGTNINDDSGVTMEISTNVEDDSLMQQERKVEYYQYDNFEHEKEFHDSSIEGEFVYHDDELKQTEEPVVQAELQFEHKVEEPYELNMQTEQRARSDSNSSASSVEKEEDNTKFELELEEPGELNTQMEQRARSDSNSSASSVEKEEDNTKFELKLDEPEELNVQTEQRARSDSNSSASVEKEEDNTKFEHKFDEPEELNVQTEQRARSDSNSSASSVEKEEENTKFEHKFDEPEELNVQTEQRARSDSNSSASVEKEEDNTKFEHKLDEPEELNVQMEQRARSDSNSSASSMEKEEDNTKFEHKFDEPEELNVQTEQRARSDSNSSASVEKEEDNTKFEHKLDEPEELNVQMEQRARSDSNSSASSMEKEEDNTKFEHKLDEPEELNVQTEQRARSDSSSSASSVEEKEKEDNIELVITEEETKIDSIVVEAPQPTLIHTRSRSSSKSSSTSEEHEKEEEMTREGETTVEKEANIFATMPDEQSEEANSPNKVSSPGEVIEENGLDEPPHDPNIAKESWEKEEFHFTDMSSIAYKFEMGKMQRDADETKSPVIEDFTAADGGIYENEPTVDPNIVHSSDRINVGEELPEVGTARNIVEKFQTIQSESKLGIKKIEHASPEATGPSEYVSEPREVMEQYVGKVEGGVWESTPQVAEDVIKSDEKAEDILPERGMAKNVAARFKQLESEVENKPPPSPSQRAITPDRTTGKVEFVSEPRSTFARYEGKSEAGVFESEPSTVVDIIRHGEYVEDVIPEKGSAKNLVSKFKQFETEVSNKPPPSPSRRELTPDRTGKVEYVSEPTKFVERFEGKSDTGVFENEPSDHSDVIKSSLVADTQMYERGYAKNVADKFREIEKNASSPPDQQRKFKEFTPPHDDNHVYESVPVDRADLVKHSSFHDSPLPEKGIAKSLASKFKQLSVDASSTKTSARTKGFTPPRESGVFENDPKAPLVTQNRQAETGVVENQPLQRDDVARENLDSVDSGDLPEVGHAKNLLNKFRQIESDSGKTSPSKSYKEFTPPREEAHIQALLSPRSPAAGSSESVSPSDLPGQYQQQVQPGISENQPVEREDIAREQESDWLIGMPQTNVTKGLVNRFKEIQSQATISQEKPKLVQQKGKKPGWAREKEPEPQQDEKGLFLAVTTEKCASCQKTVYAMERLEMNKHVYHRACFKCSHCKARLTPGTYSVNESVIYCTTHFKQLFARKGNYDEGFGRQQYKKKWKSEPNLFHLSLTETESQI